MYFAYGALVTMKKCAAWYRDALQKNSWNLKCRSRVRACSFHKVRAFVTVFVAVKSRGERGNVAIISCYRHLAGSVKRSNPSALLWGMRHISSRTYGS